MSTAHQHGGTNAERPPCTIKRIYSGATSRKTSRRWIEAVSFDFLRVEGKYGWHYIKTSPSQQRSRPTLMMFSRVTEKAGLRAFRPRRAHKTQQPNRQSNLKFR